MGYINNTIKNKQLYKQIVSYRILARVFRFIKSVLAHLLEACFLQFMQGKIKIFIPLFL